SCSLFQGANVFLPWCITPETCQEASSTGRPPPVFNETCPANHHRRGSPIQPTIRPEKSANRRLRKYIPTKQTLRLSLFAEASLKAPFNNLIYLSDALVAL